MDHASYHDTYIAGPDFDESTPYRSTTYAVGSQEHHAIAINWLDVEQALGERHDGSPDDDQRIVDALLASGAPAWVREADGGMDELGLFWIGPAVQSTGTVQP